MTTIADNLQRVRARIAKACAAAGRDPATVSLLAVSKTFGPQAVAEAATAGAAGLDALQWHCIGPVQSNKTRLVAEHFDWVQTIDRLKTAERLAAQRPAHLPALQICLQVNVDGGQTKAGVPPEEALALAQAVAQLPQLRVRGLMSIPEQAPDFEAQLAVHLSAKRLFDHIRAQGVAGLEDFDTLSLGMTADLEAAIHAGSTMVRVGTGIFGSRPRANA